MRTVASLAVIGLLIGGRLVIGLLQLALIPSARRQFARSQTEV